MPYARQSSREGSNCLVSKKKIFDTNVCFLFSSARQESPNCSSNASGRDGEVRVGGICSTYRVFS